MMTEHHRYIDDRLCVSVILACQYIGIGRTLFYSEWKSGRIVAIKSGRRTLVPLAELQAYIARLTDVAKDRTSDEA
jgi:excisionase family DNA binding protein